MVTLHNDNAIVTSQLQLGNEAAEALYEYNINQRNIEDVLTRFDSRDSHMTPWDSDWHTVRIKRRVGSGLIEVYWDDMAQPVMRANDRTFQWGQVGIGSFDDTGDWDDIRLFGVRSHAPE